LASIIALPAAIIAILNYHQNLKKQQQDSPPLTTLDTSKYNEIYHILSKYYNDQELRTLCFTLGVEYENLPFSGRSNKARELVTLMDRNGHIAELEAQVRKDRPHLFPLEEEANTKEDG
jgi:hypothetical protein